MSKKKTSGSSIANPGQGASMNGRTSCMMLRVMPSRTIVSLARPGGCSGWRHHSGPATITIFAVSVPWSPRGGDFSTLLTRPPPVRCSCRAGGLSWHAMLSMGSYCGRSRYRPGHMSVTDSVPAPSSCRDSWLPSRTKSICRSA